jgi:hypothetical protein
LYAIQLKIAGRTGPAENEWQSLSMGTYVSLLIGPPNAPAARELRMRASLATIVPPPKGWDYVQKWMESMLDGEFMPLPLEMRSQEMRPRNMMHYLRLLQILSENADCLEVWHFVWDQIGDIHFLMDIVLPRKIDELGRVYETVHESARGAVVREIEQAFFNDLRHVCVSAWILGFCRSAGWRHCDRQNMVRGEIALCAVKTRLPDFVAAMRKFAAAAAGPPNNHAAR